MYCYVTKLKTLETCCFVVNEAQLFTRQCKINSKGFAFSLNELQISLALFWSGTYDKCKTFVKIKGSVYIAELG